MILSLASVILVIIRIGIGLGIEFAEKKEIREMREKIDDTLKNEWIGNVQSFLVARADYPKTRGKGVVDEEKITKEIVELGEATRYARIGSTLLKVLSKIMSDIVKEVISIVGGAIIFSLLVWAAFSYLELTILPPFAFATLLFLALMISITRRNIRGYVFLRSQFYELSEKPSLSKAKEIAIELERRELIYA